MTDIVGKLWEFCHTLRHDGIGYGALTKKDTALRGLATSARRTPSDMTIDLRSMTIPWHNNYNRKTEELKSVHKLLV